MLKKICIVVYYFPKRSYNSKVGWHLYQSDTIAGRMCRRLAGNGKICVLAGRMCRRLADSRKISHQREACNTAVFLLPFEIWISFYR